MSVLMPNGRDWLVSGWISHGFFEDAASFLADTPRLKDEILFCQNASVDTLDLRKADRAMLEEVGWLTEAVIARNREQRVSNFRDPEHFPVYIEKLEGLRRLIGEALNPDEPHP